MGSVCLHGLFGESIILDRHNSKLAEETIEWLWIDRIVIEKAIELQTRKKYGHLILASIDKENRHPMTNR